MIRSLLLLCFLPLLSIAQKKTFTINGELAGLKDKSLVYLTNINNPTDTLAKSTVAKGKYVLKGSLDEPSLYHLNFGQPQKKVLLFLDNNKVSLSGKVDDVKKIKVEGSPSHKDFQAFENTFNQLFSRYNEVNQLINTRGLSDSLALESGNISAQIQKEIDAYTAANKDSYVTPFMLLVTAQLSSDMQALENRYATLNTDVQQSYYGKFIKEMIENSKVGAV